MKFFLIFVYLSASGSPQFMPVASFDNMRNCISAKQEMVKQKAEIAQGSYNCVWMDGD